MQPKFETREDWLLQMSQEIAPLFAIEGVPLPSFRVTCGFPCTGATRSKGRNMRLGECHAASSSKDAHCEIFIHPELDDPIKVVEVLAHELVHAAVGVAAGHGQSFKRVATAIGLTGPMRSTTGTPSFHSMIKPWINACGPYPHASLTVLTHKKQGTRLLKAVCDCGYTVRLTAKWAALGLPICVCGNEFNLA